MSKVAKYVHIALTNAEGKWKDIALFNLAKEMSSSEAKAALSELTPRLVQQLEDMVTELKQFGCPDVIVARQESLVVAAKGYKHKHLRNLARRIC